VTTQTFSAQRRSARERALSQAQVTARALYGFDIAADGKRVDLSTSDAPASIEIAADREPGRELVLVSPEISLDQRATSINRHLALADKAEGSAKSHRISAGRELIAAREHVSPGEWIAWCKANIKRSYRDIKRLTKIAGADDPEAALEQDRAKAREGMAATRAKGTNVSPPKREFERGGGEDGTEPKPEQYRFAYFNRAGHAANFAFWQDKAPKPNKEMLEWADGVIEAWVKLRDDLKERMGVTEPTVVPLYREDGVTPICNCELDAERKDETRATVDSILHAMLDGEPDVWFNQMFSKTKTMVGASMKLNGWDVIFQAKRKKTKAEIADFEAREKALHDAPASGDTIWATIDDSDIAADPALSAAYEAKKAADSRYSMSLAESNAAHDAFTKLSEAAITIKLEAAMAERDRLAAEQPPAIAAE
jgi:hypothetical protein